MKTATKSHTSEAATTVSANGAGACRHHWLLGQPVAGHVPAVCRKCGVSRDYPAVLDDLDPPAELTPQGTVKAVTDHREDVVTAAGGARPSPVGQTARRSA